MSSPVREAFVTLLSRMEEPPGWEEIDSVRAISPQPERSVPSGPVIAVGAAMVTIVLIGLIGLLRSEAEPADDISGVWQVESYAVAGQSHDVRPGVNAIQQPWLMIDEDSMHGNAGCNRFEGTYEYGEDFLIADLVKDAGWCGPDEGELMDAELAFERVIWEGDTVDVSFLDGRMVWSSSSVWVEFVSIESPPTQQIEPTATNQIGQLDCAPSVVQEAVVPNDGQGVLEVAQAADSLVVTVTEWEPGRYSGLSGAGDVVVEMALGDSVGGGYQVWTCSE